MIIKLQAVQPSHVTILRRDFIGIDLKALLVSWRKLLLRYIQVRRVGLSILQFLYSNNQYHEAAPSSKQETSTLMNYFPYKGL